MDIEYAEKYCDALLDYAFDMLWRRETCGVNHAEFIFVRLAQFMADDVQLRDWFLKNVKSTLEGGWPDIASENRRPRGYIPSEVVEYIAHVKRWPEFERVALSELDKHRNDQVYLMGRNLPASILDAMEDAWEDRDMYESLQNVRPGA